MVANARREAESAPVDDALVRALNEVAPELLKTVATPIIEQSLRKWLRQEPAGPQDDLPLVVDLAAALIASVHLFAPSLSGVRPIDRLARAALLQGGDGARAIAALARSKFAVFHVESFGEPRLATARDCVTGVPLKLVSDGFGPIVLDFDVAARLVPLGDARYWPMGPMVPVGPHGADAAAAFPTRPGKGLINEAHVAATIYREYVRAGAPLGVDFGLRPEIAKVSFVDAELVAYARAMRESGAGPAPSGAMLAQLRGLLSLTRLTSALYGAIELAESGANDVAAIYRAAAREFIDMIAERSRVGSASAAKFEGLPTTLAEMVRPSAMRVEVRGLLDELMREARPPASQAPGGDLARVIERIRALRKMTVERGCSEQEALLAAEKVGEMLQRYGLSLSEVELRQQTCEGFGFDLGRKQAAPIDECFHVVAFFCDCRMWSEVGANGGRRHVFFGLPADVEAARAVKDLVEAAFATETEAFKRGKLYGEADSSERRALVKSFQFGLSGGVARKLTALKQAREKSTSGSKGRDLMIVKRSIVDEELEKLGLAFNSKKSRGKRVISDAYDEGVVASHRFQVNEKIA